MNAPIKKFNRVYHVGMLAAQPAPRSRDSQEGPCLSISRVPNAWRAIAQLGAAPIWTLEKKDGKFLDMHKVSEALKAEITQWGYDKGYAVEGQAVVTEVDDQDEDGEDEVRIYLDATPAEAVRQHGEDDEVRARFTIPHPRPTDKLVEYAEQKVDLGLVFDMLALVYSEKVLDIDGLFWNENLDVYAYSAPRAGLLRSKLSTWTFTQGHIGHNKEEQY